MIKRHYFFHARWHHNDGTTSSTFVSGDFTTKSWFVSSSHVYKLVSEYMREECGTDHPTGMLEIICISRL